MVHAGHHGHHCLPIGKAQYRHLRPGEKFLYHHPAARGAERAVLHHAFHSGHGGRLIFANKHTLSKGQAVRLHHHRVFVLCADIGARAFRIAKRLIACGGDAVLFHQILGKHLAGLDACSGLIGAKRRNALFCQRVHHAQGKGVVRRHHHIIYGVLHRPFHHGLHVRGLDGHTFGVRRNAPVARRAVKLWRRLGLFQFANDGVLAPAAAYDQYFHGFSSIILLL